MNQTLVERIDAALASRGGKATVYELTAVLFPYSRFPRAWRTAAQGGPPGCSMALGAALRRGGFKVDIVGCGPANRIVHSRMKKAKKK